MDNPNPDMLALLPALRGSFLGSNNLHTGQTACIHVVDRRQVGDEEDRPPIGGLNTVPYAQLPTDSKIHYGGFERKEYCNHANRE